MADAAIQINLEVGATGSGELSRVLGIRRIWGHRDNCGRVTSTSTLGSFKVGNYRPIIERLILYLFTLSSQMCDN